MSDSQAIAIRALKIMLYDAEERVWALRKMFMIMSDEQMQEPYANTTRAEILSEAEDECEKIKAAIRWVDSAK